MSIGQIATVFFFAIMAGSDNFLVACGLGMLQRERGRKPALVAAFGICEAITSLVGLWVGALLRSRVLEVASMVGPITLLASGLVIILIYLALYDRDLEGIANSGLMIFGLPLSLSLDNLVGGAGLGANGYPVMPCAVLIGLICTAMCLAGLFLGERVRHFLPRSVGAISGAWLVLVAACSFVK